jgi:hypothetical protein
MATVPHTLTSGSPAKASDVNDNFNYLDSTVQKKASQSTVDAISSAINAKADGSLKDSLKARVDTGSFSAFKAKEAGDISSLNANKTDISIKDSLKARVDTGSFSTLKANVASLNATISNTPTTASLKGIRDTVSSIQTSVSALQSGKADVSLRDSLKARVDTGSFSSFKAKEAGDVSSLNAQIGVLSSSNSLSAIRDTLARKVDSNWVGGHFVAKDADGALLNHFRVNSSATDQLNGAPWYGLGRASIPALSSTGNQPQVQLAGYFGLQLASATHTLNLPEAAGAPVAIDGNTVWHSGNLQEGSLFKERGEAPVDWTDAASIGSYTVRPENFNGPSGEYSFGDLAVFGNSNQKTQMYFSHQSTTGSTTTQTPAIWIRTRWQSTNDWMGWARVWTNGNFDPTRYVLVSGGTITGDLRISGKLTTNPGATPADYVFEPDYNLSSLSEIEAYTKANKHLPEVPSASEMTEKGVDIAAMNMVLLKKVEELTLHAIEQQKQIETQQARLDRLEAQR